MPSSKVSLRLCYHFYLLKVQRLEEVVGQALDGKLDWEASSAQKREKESSSLKNKHTYLSLRWRAQMFEGSPRTFLKDKVCDNLYFIDCKSHEKTKTNTVLECLSDLLVYPTLSAALSPKPFCSYRGFLQLCCFLKLGSWAVVSNKCW